MIKNLRWQKEDEFLKRGHKEDENIKDDSDIK